MPTITVTEHGSNRKLDIMINKILHIELLRYNTGVIVTVITLCQENRQTIHVTESYNYIKNILDNN